MEDEEVNYFVRNGCVDKLLESQTARDQVVVSFPSDHEAVFSGFKILDLELLKNSGINRFYFTFEPTSKTVVVTATLQGKQLYCNSESRNVLTQSNRHGNCNNGGVHQKAQPWTSANR